MHLVVNPIAELDVDFGYKLSNFKYLSKGHMTHSTLRHRFKNVTYARAITTTAGKFMPKRLIITDLPKVTETVSNSVKPLKIFQVTFNYAYPGPKGLSS